jgi:hypothetical protein
VVKPFRPDDPRPPITTYGQSWYLFDAASYEEACASVKSMIPASVTNMALLLRAAIAQRNPNLVDDEIRTTLHRDIEMHLGTHGIKKASQ